MRYLRPFVSILIAAFMLVGAGRAEALESARVALVIGNSDYKIAPSLINPANDARLMAETLRNLGFDVIERIDADRETIQLATFELQDRLIEAGEDAVGLFFYAGHGIQVGGENFLVPLKAEIRREREVPIKAVSANFVLKQMEFVGNRMNFVILDACRNNPFPSSTRAMTNGLSRMNAPAGTLIAYSTGPGEVAIDGGGDNSPYVLALSQAMLTLGVPAELMFKRVRESVLAATNDQQTPWEESSLKGGDFYFNESLRLSEAPYTGGDAAITQQESLFWQSIKDTKNLEMFKAYLDQYPSGTFSALARLMVRQFDTAPKDIERVLTASTSGEFDGLWEGVLTHHFAPSVVPIRARVENNVLIIEENITTHYGQIKFILNSEINEFGEVYVSTVFQGGGNWRNKVITFKGRFSRDKATGTMTISQGRGKFVLRRVDSSG